MKLRFRSSKVLTIAVGHFFHDIYTSILAPILPLLVDKLGITMAMAGMLDVVRKSPTILNPFFGIIADRICVKYIIIITPAITGISMSLLGLAPSYPILLILLFTAGLSSALFHIPSPVLIKKFAPNNTGTAMSFYMVGGELSRTLGPLFITAAISWWGFEGSWRIMPISIIASILLFAQLKDLKREDLIKQDKKTEKAIQTLKRHLGFFSTISGYTLFRSGMKLSLTLYLPVYMTIHGASLWLAGIALSVFQFSGVGGTLLAGYFSDKIGKKNVLLIAGILSPILMFWFTMSETAWQFPILILLGLVVFAPGPVMLTLVQDTNTDRPSLMNSIYMTISFSISSLMALMVGIMSDFWNIDISFKICVALAVFSIPFVFLLKPKS